MINNQSISVSCLNYKDKKKYIRLLKNKLNNKENVKPYFISSLSKFDYLLQFSVNFFEFESFNIINELKGKSLGESVWASYRIFNDEGTLTLDNMSIQKISEELVAAVKPVNPWALLSKPKKPILA